MISLKKYQKKKFAIYGMGRSGYATAKALRLSKAEFICWDDNKALRRKFKKNNFIFQKFWTINNFQKIDYIVISPGIDLDNCNISFFLKKNFHKVITDIDLFFNAVGHQNIIAITGTNGKSTTCKILENIFTKAGYDAQVGGNIGRPALLLKQSKIKKNIVYILEVSSYQLAYSKQFRAKHAAILNISIDHLERHKSLKEYIKIKSKIFLFQKNSDFSYINMHNQYSKNVLKIIKFYKNKKRLFKLERNNFKSLLNRIKNTRINNQCNLENIIFACKISKNFKIKNKVILNAVNNFRGLPHRQEIVFSSKKLICINDSKATSFDACLQSLKSHNKIYWIVGGLPKFKDKFDLKNVSNKIVKAYIIGKHVSYFKNKIKKDVNCVASGNLRQALKNIFNDVKNNLYEKSTILLSPASASFDQFKDFEERGNFFKILIKKNINKIYHA